MPKPSDLKRLQKEKINAACFARNLIDLSSSEEYESINSNSNKDNDSDNYDFIYDNNDDNKFQKSGRPKTYIGLSAWTRQRKKKILKEAAVGSLKITSFFPTNDENEQVGTSENEYSNSESEDEEC
ncbi:25597_t:CDS:2 [Dentiscutata erythropus]|uniref:25597_t:CDS:1 n=1 Tax=Dentiscutata erythropus TaxID=1348616 RepID=A0A9N9HXP7_9GLOM|nr:25597_t:CDS:2 [Dentiscutata erythropus]